MTAAAGSPPFDIDRVTLGSATNWNEFTFAPWVRTAIIHNVSGAALYFGSGLGSGAVGAFPPANSVNFDTLADGEEVAIPIDDARGFTLCLGSSTASAIVALRQSCK